jgi:hypothetical protein
MGNSRRHLEGGMEQLNQEETARIFLDAWEHNDSVNDMSLLSLAIGVWRRHSETLASSKNWTECM